MGVIKPSGKNSAESRKQTMHGSKNEARAMKLAADLRRGVEKPGKK